MKKILAIFFRIKNFVDNVIRRNSSYAKTTHTNIIFSSQNGKYVQIIACLTVQLIDTRVNILMIFAYPNIYWPIFYVWQRQFVDDQTTLNTLFISLATV